MDTGRDVSTVLPDVNSSRVEMLVEGEKDVVNGGIVTRMVSCPMSWLVVKGLSMVLPKLTRMPMPGTCNPKLVPINSMD